MRDTPPEYNDDDLLEVLPHDKPCLVRRTTQRIGILLFVLIALMLLIYFFIWR